MYKSIIEIPFSKELFDSLYVEKDNGNDRCSITLSKTKTIIQITLLAKDIVALRAFTMGITRLIQTFEGLK